MQVFFLLFIVFSSSSAFKIFMYSTPMGFSHVQLMHIIATTLHNAGHNVTVLHPVLEQRFVAYWDKSPVRKIYVTPPPKVRKTYENYRHTNVWELNTLYDRYEHIKRLLSAQHHIFVMAPKGILQYLKYEQFDMEIFEFFGACGVGIGEKIEVKTHMMVSAIGLVDSMAPVFDSPLMPSYIPGLATRFTDKMNFVQRFINFGLICLTEVVYPYIVFEPYEKIMAAHGITADIRNIVRKKSNFVLVNWSDEFLDPPRPLSKKVVYIGGIVQGKLGNLSQEFQSLLNLRPNGTVVISFGTIAPTASMPPNIKHAIHVTVKRFPDYTFIWKTDAIDTYISNGIGNLETVSWLPQRELLGDSRVKLFVTHAGMNSVLETVRSGVPTILVPIFADQFKNAAVMQSKNTSIIIDKDDFSTKLFSEALDKILNDKIYTLRAKRLANLMATKTATPEDRLLEAVEFSGKFGKIHDLDVHGFEMNFAQYFCLDVIAAWISFFVIILYFVFHCIRFIVSGILSLSVYFGKQKAD